MDYPGTCIMSSVITEISQKYKNENIIIRSHEADKFEQFRIFTLLSRTEAIGRVTFA